MPVPAGLRLWARRAALAALCLLAALQLWYGGWVVYWKWHNPDLTAFMQRDLERRNTTAPGAAQRPRAPSRPNQPGLAIGPAAQPGRGRPALATIT